MAKTPKGISSDFEAIRADYDMSRQSRFVRRRTGVAAQGSGADYHYRIESKYYNDIEQARDMDRNDALVGTLADRRVDNIIQEGFTLDPKTGDKKLDLEIWNRWQAWSTDPDQCDIAGEMCWKELERHMARADCIDGDSIAVGTNDWKFQVLESHTIQTLSTMPNTFCGVEMNEFRKRLRYHTIIEEGSHATKRQGEPIEVRDSTGLRQLFHLYSPKRVNQTRGVTAVAPIFAMSAMLEDINFAKLVQQQAVSCFAIIRKQASGLAGPPTVQGYGESRVESSAAGIRYMEGISPGMEIISNEGEDIQGFSPNVPNAEYFQQVKMILQIIGVNFGLPLCLVLMDGSETNFSGWRGAVDEARKGFIADQINQVRKLNQPFYKWWLTKLMEEDRAIAKVAKKSNVDIFAHNWNLPTWSYIEPVADAQGDAEQLKNALTSPRRLHAARGKDWEEISEEITEDNSYAITRAMAEATKINKANPTQPPVTWRDLIPLPMPSNVTMGLQDPAVVENMEAEGEATEKATGEMSGLTRMQYKNNKKAIDEILKALIDKTTTPTRATVDLSMLGLTEATIQKLIADVSDGVVDDPAITEENNEVDNG